MAQDSHGCFSARNVLWYLVFFGFAVNYMIRINLNIAIVSMVRQKQKNNISLVSECINEEPMLVIGTSNTSHDETMRNSILVNVLNNDSVSVHNDNSPTFEWDEKQQGLVLGAFFWLHWATQIPGGLLSVKYGTKIVYGLANFTGVVLCFAIPFSAFLGYHYLILLRIIQGLVLGFAWPAMHNMTAKWIPPNERSKFVTAYLGSSVGAALTFPMCGFIIDLWGWEVLFYVCGVIGTLWYAAWFVLVFDSPAEHPRITQVERDFIIHSLGHSVSKETTPVPWKKILTSVPVWMNILAQWGGVWGLFTLLTHAPTYFKVVHGWNIRATGLLSGMPQFLRMVWAYIISLIGDYLLKSNKISRTNVRKFATSICCIGQGIFMLGLAYSGCDYLTAIIFLTAATAMHGAVSTGPLASLVDISPNYASVTLGVCNTIVAVIGFLTPITVGHLTFQNQTVGQWQKVYWIATGMLMVSGIIYNIFSKSELEPWNSPILMDSCHESELVSLKKDENEEKVLKA